MNPMTPDEARRTIQKAEALRANIPAYCWHALETVAGMRTEYREEEWQGLVIGWVPTSPWTPEKHAGSTDPNTRIVRRYTTEPEEA